MTDSNIPEAEQDTHRIQIGEETAETATMDLAGLMKSLFDKVVDAQVSLFQARHRRDLPAVDRALLQVRAAALLLASIPAPSLDALRFKVLAAAVLKVEDDDVSSLARRMVEYAIRQDDVRLQGRPWLGQMASV